MSRLTRQRWSQGFLEEVRFVVLTKNCDLLIPNVFLEGACDDISVGGGEGMPSMPRILD